MMAGCVMLAGATGHDDLVIRGARVVDPAQGLDQVIDVRIDGGTIAQIGLELDTNEHRVVESAS